MQTNCKSNKQTMGSESESRSSTSVSRLPLFSSLSSGKSKGPTPTTVMTTPPIHTAASIPFQWEEAPGKPRSCPSSGTDQYHQPKPKSARCLELPPRLLAEAKVASMPSPTPTTTDSAAARFRKAGSFRSPDDDVDKEKKLVVMFGSSRWAAGSLFRKQQPAADHRRRVSFDFSSADPVVDGGGGTKVKITRVKRKGSLFSLPHHQPTSHVLTSIYESFKQVVPWRRGQGSRTMKKKGGDS